MDGEEKEAETRDEQRPSRFGLVSSELLDELLADCKGPDAIFHGVVYRIRALLERQELRVAPVSVQIETELEIDDLLQDIKTSVYAHGSCLNEEVGESPWWDGVAQIPHRAQFVAGLHTRVTALYRSLGVE
ncbi:unnamed protein product [Phytophthora lilii]|uniref:Unnamed protein product n=1 Tax=Phytophthora lilii TaxID=2077276 RepID=A0A9W7D8K3_9STRA|nr:unnamed protein product [Phytophthora lilii]